jgi:tryptophan synthase alpha chain
MMNRIARAFEHVHHKKTVIPFLVAGDSSLEESQRAFETLLEFGADILEIGIPYSDPLADGPVIQRASARSLANGFSLEDAFTLTQRLREKTDKALILFTYVNPVLQYGIRKFCEKAAESGADGMIIPDLPLEEADSIREEADKANFALIPLVSPTSDESRIQAIAEKARGFLYCVSALGVTGERTSLSDEAKRLVTTARKYTNLPVAVGFGIGSPEQAKRAAEFADGVIVGSAYIRRIEENLDFNSIHGERFGKVIDSLREFTTALVEATSCISMERTLTR